jgi:rhodanese-related sulfurtransferase
MSVHCADRYLTLQNVCLLPHDYGVTLPFTGYIDAITISQQQMANIVTSKELPERQDEYTYVDVREADELEEGMIEGAMNIPLGLLIRKARHGDLDDLKRKKIVTYCSGGYRGNIAGDELNKLGFDTANIEGGYSAYKNEGH